MSNSLENLKDCSPPGSYVHGILQTRMLEWVAVSFSKGSSWPRDWTRGLLRWQANFFTTEPLGKPPIWASLLAQLLKNSPARRPWRRDRLPTPVFWPGEFHGLYSPWGCRVRHDWANFTFTFHTFICVYKHPRWFSSETSPCQYRRGRKHRCDLWVREIPWRGSTQVLLPR